MSKRKKKQNSFCLVLINILEIYLFFSAIALLGGMAVSEYKYSGCGKFDRLERAFPTYRLGCWLTEELPKDNQ